MLRFVALASALAFISSGSALAQDPTPAQDNYPPLNIGDPAPAIHIRAAPPAAT